MAGRFLAGRVRLHVFWLFLDLTVIKRYFDRISILVVHLTRFSDRKLAFIVLFFIRQTSYYEQRMKIKSLEESFGVGYQ